METYFNSLNNVIFLINLYIFLLFFMQALKKISGAWLLLVSSAGRTLLTFILCKILLYTRSSNMWPCSLYEVCRWKFYDCKILKYFVVNASVGLKRSLFMSHAGKNIPDHILIALLKVLSKSWNRFSFLLLVKGNW